VDWWLWLLIGLGLLAVELFTPGGFYVVFFGVGALVVGALTGFGAGGPPWTQWLIFSAVSILSLLLFRRRLLARTGMAGPSVAMDTLEGEIAIPMEDIAPGAHGKAELRGTSWNAENIDTQPLAKGRRCRVTRVQGLTLLLRA
jgi:membrane protein implicated in regulation of membrane protease activity